jgi:hypothetical protein
MVTTFNAITLDDVCQYLDPDQVNDLMGRVDKNVSYGDAAWTLVDAKTFSAWLPDGVEIPELKDNVFVAIRG